MKKTDAQSLCSYILPRLPKFRQKGLLLYQEPVDNILRAFHFDGSGFDRNVFYFYVFFMPLYVPIKHVHFSFAQRLRPIQGQGTQWRLDEPQVASALISAIHKEGIPFLDAIATPNDAAHVAAERYNLANPHTREAVAYSLLMAENFDEARSALDRVGKGMDLNVPWQREILERIKLVQQKLSIDPRSATQQLLEWARFTKQNLGLVE